MAIRSSWLGPTALILLLSACAARASQVGEQVDFDSPQVAALRQTSCSQDFEAATRIGAAAAPENASGLWSVSPYQVLLPQSGEGYVMVHIDAPHFDWLLYTSASATLESLDEPALEFGGDVEVCGEPALVEYGLHPPEPSGWPLRIVGEPGTRVLFYAGLAQTDHSDPSQAGHAGHDLSGDVGAGGVDHGDGQ
ncbi:MAG: hypothetical protein OEZ06_13390 [Myxococcales bacterium]|nr:hypothetical protein [Myxococcales bacterium]